MEHITIKIKPFMRIESVKSYKRKQFIKSLCLGIICVAVITTAFWHGMNKELCNRDYTEQVYKDMKLTCN